MYNQFKCVVLLFCVVMFVDAIGDHIVEAVLVLLRLCMLREMSLHVYSTVSIGIGLYALDTVLSICLL